MSQDKKIEFSFGFDEGSLAKIRTGIQLLIGDFTKLVELSSKLGGGLPGVGGNQPLLSVGGKGGVGTNPQAARALAQTPAAGKPLVQNVLDHRNLFKGLADGSKDSMRLMSDALKQAVSSQRKELQDLDRAAGHLSETYDELGKKMKGLQSGSREHGDVESQRRGILNDQVSIHAERAKAKKGLAGLEETGRGMGLPGMGEEEAKGKSIWSKDLFGPGMSAGLRMGGMALAGGMAALNESYAGGGVGWAALRAERTKSITPLFNQLMNGDAKTAYALTNMSAEDRTGIIDATLSGAAGAKVVVEQGKGALGGIAAGLGMGSGSAPGGIGGAGSREGSIRADMMNAQIQASIQAMEPMIARALDQFSSQVGSRIATGRVLGTGLSRPGGVGAYVDSAGRFKAKMLGRGYSDDEYAGAYASMRSAVGEGTAARHWADSAMTASAAGYGNWGGLVQASLRSGTGGLMPQKKGYKGPAQYETAFAQAAIGGNIAPGAGIQLGQTILGEGFDPMGTTNGMGLLAAVQNGMEWHNDQRDFNQVKNVGAGMGLLDKITTGGLSPYQQGRNLVSAIKLLPGASVMAQDYLANGMNVRQMADMAAGGKLTASAKSLNLSRETIGAQLGNMVSSFTDTWVDTGGNDPMAKTMRKYRKSGKGLKEFLKTASDEETSDIGVYFARESQEGEAAGLGAVGAIKGLDGKIKKPKGGLGGGMGEGETASANAAEKAQLETSKALEASAARMIKGLEESTGKAVKANEFAADMGADGKRIVELLTNIEGYMKGQRDSERDKDSLDGVSLVKKEKPLHVVRAEGRH